jgi:hypothetical protein
MSIFKEYYSDHEFVDRYVTDVSNGIDVIIPVYHTNELWNSNLISIYREVPVKRLLISDGGVIDNSLEVVKQFPRVEIFDHRRFKTLGKCVAELVKEVSAEWFIYLHSDVFLPPGWFDSMIHYKGQYDWYGCPMNVTVLVNYRLEEPLRPYAGSQIGRKAAFINGIDKIDDDFVYRQEDFVFNKIVEDAGFKTGKVEDTFHYHQLMFRKSQGYDLNVQSVSVQTKTNEWERQRAAEMQVKGIVKYLDPEELYVIRDFHGHVYEMLANNKMPYKDLYLWVEGVNRKWLPFLKSALRQVKRDKFKKSLRKLVGR